MCGSPVEFGGEIDDVFGEGVHVAGVAEVADGAEAWGAARAVVVGEHALRFDGREVEGGLHRMTRATTMMAATMTAAATEAALT